MTYEECFNKWIIEHSILVSESTTQTYFKDSKVSLKFWCQKDVISITRADIIDFINYEIGREYKSGTIRSHFKVVKSTFEWAFNNNIITQNPCIKIPLPRKSNGEIHPFTEDEMNKILAVKCPEWVHNAILIAYRTGMRKGEIFALKWTDINFDERFIMVQRTQSVVKNQLILKEPKTKSSRRRIGIDNKLLLELEKMREKSISEYVFATKDGNCKIPWELSCKRFKAVCERANVSVRRFHDLRHTHATVLLSHGVYPKVVSERLGHSSTKITQDIYCHVTPEMQQTAVDIFEKI